MVNLKPINKQGMISKGIPARIIVWNCRRSNHIHRMFIVFWPWEHHTIYMLYNHMIPSYPSCWGMSTYTNLAKKTSEYVICITQIDENSERSGAENPMVCCPTCGLKSGPRNPDLPLLRSRVGANDLPGGRVPGSLQSTMPWVTFWLRNLKRWLIDLYIYLEHPGIRKLESLPGQKHKIKVVANETNKSFRRKT